MERIRDKKNEKGHNGKHKCMFRPITAREGSAKRGFQGYSGNLMPTAKHSWGLKAARDFKEQNGKCYWL